MNSLLCQQSWLNWTFFYLFDQCIFVTVDQVWDLTAGKLLHDFKFHEGHIRSIDFHPLEFLLATGNYGISAEFPWAPSACKCLGSFVAPRICLRKIMLPILDQRRQSFVLDLPCFSYLDCSVRKSLFFIFFYPFSFSSSVGGGKGSWELNFMIFVKIGCCPLDCCYLYNIVNLPEKELELKEKKCWASY